MGLIAYHNDQSNKDAILAQLAKHREADELIKGHYWENGKGCAVGCTIYSDDHMKYEAQFGIPVMLARLEDCIFEGLLNDKAKLWPERFMGAIKPGSDLSKVGWQFLHWLLTDEKVNPGIKHPTVKTAVKRCADVVHQLSKGGTVDESAAWSAESAESAARSAARSARSARSAWSAARSAARSAAWSAA
jgi:hypothetical protein